MTRDEIREALCLYHPESPDYYWRADCDKLAGVVTPEPAQPGCGCDNCFYGKHRLAVELLRHFHDPVDQASSDT